MFYLMTFQSTHDAIQAEEAVKSQGLKARIVGTPETISADCGLSLKYGEDQKEDVENILASSNLSSSRDIYAIIEQESGRKSYEKL